MEAKLVVVGGKANMGEVKLRLPMTIGRGNKADLIISHPTVSRIHCKLSEVDGQLVVRDNSSSNGTFVDDQQVSESVVRPGQQLKIGPITFRAEYDIAEVLPAPPSTDTGPGVAETTSIDRDNFDFLGDDIFGEAEEKEEKTAPAAKLPEKAKSKPEAKPKEQPAQAKKAPPPAPAKPAKQEPPKVADETAVFEPGAALNFEETTADKGDGKSMFEDIEEPASNSGTAATVEMPAERGNAPEMEFDFLSELKFDDAPGEPPAAPSPPEASAVAPAVEEPEPTAEPEAPVPQSEAPAAAEAEKVSADDFDFLADVESGDVAEAPQADAEPPQSKSAEPKFFEPKPTEPAVSFDFTGDLGITETKPFHMPHIPAAEDTAPPSTPPAEEPEKIAAADFDFLAELEPEPIAEAPVVEPPVAPEAVEPELVEPEAISPVNEEVASKTASTEELDLVFDFDEAPAAPQPVAEQPSVEEPAIEEPVIEEPIAEESEAPVAEEPQWPGVTEEPAAAAVPSFDFEELAASAPPEPVPFTPDAESPAPEPEVAAAWSPPAEAESAAPQAAADVFDFLDAAEPASAPTAEPETPKFHEPHSIEPAVAFDFTGDLGIAETQQFVMPKGTPDENPPPFSFAPAAEAAPAMEPEISADEPEAESPFAPVPVAKTPTAPRPVAAPKQSFVDKLKALLGLGGKKKAPAVKKSAAAAGLEAAVAAPVAAPKFEPRRLDDAPIPLFDDEPASPPVDVAPPAVESVGVAPQIDVAPPEGEADSLFDELAMMGSQPAAPVLEPPVVESGVPATDEPIADVSPVDVAPQIDVAPPEGEAHSLFDELQMMEGAPTAEPEKKFYEPTPTVERPVSVNLTGDIGIAPLQPFEMPHSAAAEETASPAAAVPQAADEFFDDLFGLNEPAAESTPIAEPPAAESPVPVAEETAAPVGDDLFADFAESASAPSEPVAEPPAAEEASPIAAAAAGAKSELEDLFASFTGAAPAAASEQEADEPAMTEPVAESSAADVAARDESPFNELFAPDDAPELARPETAAMEASPAAPLPISAELAAPPAEPVGVGATRPYVIDVDVRHTYLNRMAVRVAAKMSQLAIPDLEPEMPAGRSFNRVGKPPEPPRIEEPAVEDAAEPSPAVGAWDESPAETNAAETVAPPGDSAEAGFFPAETEEDSPFADWAPPEEPAAPEAAAPAKTEEPKRPAPASPTPAAKPASKDDDLDDFLNDLGMG